MDAGSRLASLVLPFRDPRKGATMILSRLVPAPAAAAVLLLGAGPLASGPPAGSALSAQEPAAGSAPPSSYMAEIEGAQRPDRGGLDAFTLDELMEEFGVPGVGVAVIRDFGIHWAKGYGVADVESGRPVDTETLFQAASMSKPVAALAVIKAVEDGYFGLDDDVNDVLTSWTLPGGGYTRERPVTPRALTSHTSGLGDGFGFPGYEPGEPLPTVLQILEGEEPSNVGEVFMERPPMTAQKYSGGGVTVMQLALTDAVGRPFPELLHDWVLEPAGMTASTFRQPLPPARQADAARAHDGRGERMGPPWHVYPELAAAGLWTTPTELARLLIEVQRTLRDGQGRVASRPAVGEMVSPVGVGDFAVGFSVEKRGEGWYFGHGGSNWGFRGLMLAHKVKGYGVVVMTNASRGSVLAREIEERVERAYGWDSLDDPLVR